MARQLKIVGILICIVLLQSCGSKNSIQYDTPQQGTIHISVDESFEPVINEQLKVYKSTFPKSNIIVDYKAEAACLRDLQQDSTRLIIVARGLNKQEQDYYKTKLSFEAQFKDVAYDAVAMIINADAKDSVFSLQKIHDMLAGKDSSLKVVVDGNNATSTVRYLMDSVLHGTAFGKNVTAGQGSKAVINFIANNPGAIGFVGSSWVTNMDDPEQVEASKKIKLALVECPRCDKGTYAKPSQETIAYHQYPFVRPLFYILKENTTGLGTGFTNFMSLERGQLIFRRSYLVPSQMYFGIRTTLIK
jgi:phosphate transport system substrate-binding protein